MSLIDGMPTPARLAADELEGVLRWALERGYAEFFSAKLSAGGQALTLSVRVRMRNVGCRRQGDVG